MDEPLDRSPVDKRDDYYGGRSGRSRSRSRSPPRRQRSRSGSRDRRRSSHRDGDRDRDRDSRRETRDRDGGRRRSRSRSPSRERRSSRRDDDVNYPGSSTRGGYGGGGFSSRGGRGGFRGGRGGFSSHDSAPRGNREAVAQEAIQKSKKENRVYIGNLSFQVRWHDLKEFCSKIGPVAFAEIIQLPNGMSKGCGVVEYSTQDDAQRAIKELNEQELFGRPVFLREDREEEARYGSAAVSNRTSFPGAAYQTSASGGRAPPPASVPSVFAPPGPRGLYVTGMSPNIGWQDLKDLFRAAGNVMRADINIDHTTGQSKGTGVVVMESKTEANAAISMFNGYEFDGGRLEVREDRFYHINAARGAHGGLPGARGGRGGGRGGFGGHMSHSNGGGGGYSGGRSTDNLYGDYAGPDGDSRGGDSGAGGDVEMSGGGGGFSGGRGGFGGGRGRGGFRPEERHRDIISAAPSTQIFVKNLPWSTSDDDLVELFQTTGTVVFAGIIWENGRSRGNGIVQFASIEEAETAIAKFQNYQYGGRPLGLAFNARWKDFSIGNGAGSAANGEQQGGEMEAQNGNGMDEQEQQAMEANEQPMEAI